MTILKFHKNRKQFKFKKNLNNKNSIIFNNKTMINKTSLPIVLMTLNNLIFDREI